MTISPSGVNSMNDRFTYCELTIINLQSKNLGFHIGFL